MISVSYLPVFKFVQLFCLNYIVERLLCVENGVRRMHPVVPIHLNRSYLLHIFIGFSAKWYSSYCRCGSRLRSWERVFVPARDTLMITIPNGLTGKFAFVEALELGSTTGSLYLLILTVVNETIKILIILLRFSFTNYISIYTLMLWHYNGVHRIIAQSGFKCTVFS